MIEAFGKRECMELSDLSTFAAVAHAQGITAAARELHTVQSNVTSRIKGLEEEIGLALFTRHSRGMVLTDAGRRLLPYAERLLASSARARSAAADNGVPQGSLTIGSMETTAAVRMPALLSEYHRACPQVRLSLQTGPTAQLIAGLLDRTLDAAFVAGPLDHPDLVAYPAFTEELVLVTPRQIKTEEDLRRMASQGLTALMFKIGCSYRQRLEQALAAAGLPVASRLELGTLDGILGCVAVGMGVTLLPRTVVERSVHATAFTCHRVGPEHERVTTLLAHRRDGYVGSALKHLTTLASAAG
jgi:DNA-binding transcriptional LysR family regulator